MTPKRDVGYAEEAGGFAHPFDSLASVMHYAGVDR